MILVTGATGTVGGAVVRQLAAAGHPVRALVRQPGAGRLPDGVEVAYGDLSRPETLAAALSGVERMYLLAPLAPDLPRWEAGAIDAAGAAGVHQVAALGAAIGRPLRYVDIPESAARDGMRASGMPAVIVEAMLEFMALVRVGKADTVSDSVPALTGQPARTFEAWAVEHADAF